MAKYTIENSDWMLHNVNHATSLLFCALEHIFSCSCYCVFGGLWFAREIVRIADVCCIVDE